MNDITPPGFDALFRHNEDPWGFRTRWYEARKRAMTLACLPQARYASGFEPGCANGELTAQLAGRCERLLASDVSPRAVELARTRLAALPHVEVVQALLPDQWPAGRFDLVVISELGYFVDGPSLDVMAASKAFPAVEADDPLKVWGKWCTNLRGSGIDAGHFIAEENPEQTLAKLLPFLREFGRQ